MEPGQFGHRCNNSACGSRLRHISWGGIQPPHGSTMRTRTWSLKTCSQNELEREILHETVHIAFGAGGDIEDVFTLVVN